MWVNFCQCIHNSFRCEGRELGLVGCRGARFNELMFLQTKGYFGWEGVGFGLLPVCRLQVYELYSVYIAGSESKYKVPRHGIEHGVEALKTIYETYQPTLRISYQSNRTAEW